MSSDEPSGAEGFGQSSSRRARGNEMSPEELEEAEHIYNDTYLLDARALLDEENRAAKSGEKMFPKQLWHRMTNPAEGRPTIDHWEFKPEGELLQMQFLCDGEKYTMWFSPRSVPDYQLRPDIWIPRSNSMYKALRTRLYSIPKTLTINKVIFASTPQCEVEDCIIEFMFIKKWTCRQLEYTITGEFTQPQHLRKLIHMLKPTDITITLNFGQYQSSSDTAGYHNHLSVDIDGTMILEKDYRTECMHYQNTVVHPANPESKSMVYSDAGKGKLFASQMLRTLCAIRKFVTMMCEKKMAQTKGMNVKKFVVTATNSPNQNLTEKICPKLNTEGSEEHYRKRNEFANGERMYTCVRSDYRNKHCRAKHCSAMPSTSFKMNIGNEQLLLYTKSVPNFQCFFRTTVDESAIQTIISEWLKNDRHIEELQLHLDKVFDVNFCAQFNPDMTDPKKIKIRKNFNSRNDRRSTMYIEKERLATRHLALRVYDLK